MAIERQQEQSPEDKFRAILTEAQPLLDHLARFCQTVDDASQVISLALTNDGQLRLLMASIMNPPKGR